MTTYYYIANNYYEVLTDTFGNLLSNENWSKESSEMKWFNTLEEACEVLGQINDEINLTKETRINDTEVWIEQTNTNEIDGMRIWLKEHGFEIEKSIGGHYRCIRKKDDGTTEWIWDDSASEDAYDIECAISVAYNIVAEGLAEYTFIGNCDAMEYTILIEKDTYYGLEQAKERADYLLGNYNKSYILNSVDIYVGNDYKATID